MMPAILLYGIYGGATTPTEAAAIAAAYALILAAFSIGRCRCGRCTGHVRQRPVSASVGLVIGGALIFNYIVAARTSPARCPALGRPHVDPWSFCWRERLLLVSAACSTPPRSSWSSFRCSFPPAASSVSTWCTSACRRGQLHDRPDHPALWGVAFRHQRRTGISLRAMIAEIWAFLGVLMLALLVMILPGDRALAARLFGYPG